MKRFFRRALLLLLAMTLPVYGWAALNIAAPCPMQAKHGAPQMQNSCCNEQHSNKASNSNSCKAGQECQTGVLYISNVPVVSNVPSPHIVVALPVAHFSPQVLDAVWRPPLQS
ncbi:MAG TPA: hypothetical protein VGK97_05165 [Spongiibacteraceae bacterium]